MYNPDQDVGGGWRGARETQLREHEDRDALNPEPSTGLDPEAGLRSIHHISPDLEFKTGGRLKYTDSELLSRAPSRGAPAESGHREMLRSPVDLDWKGAGTPTNQQDQDDSGVLNTEPSNGNLVSSHRFRNESSDVWNDGAGMHKDSSLFSGVEPSQGRSAGQFRDLGPVPADLDWIFPGQVAPEEAPVYTHGPSTSNAMLAPRTYEVLNASLDWKATGGQDMYGADDRSVLNMEPSSGYDELAGMRTLEHMSADEDWRLAIHRNPSPTPLDVDPTPPQPTSCRDSSERLEAGKEPWRTVLKAPDPAPPVLDTVSTGASEQMARHSFRDAKADKGWSTSTKTDVLHTKYDRRIRVRKRGGGKTTTQASGAPAKRRSSRSSENTPAASQHGTSEIAALTAYLGSLRSCGGDPDEIDAVVEILSELHSGSDAARKSGPTPKVPLVPKRTARVTSPR
jgi:hypothetical protein